MYYVCTQVNSKSECNTLFPRKRKKPGGVGMSTGNPPQKTKFRSSDRGPWAESQIHAWPQFQRPSRFCARIRPNPKCKASTVALSAKRYKACLIHNTTIAKALVISACNWRQGTKTCLMLCPVSLGFYCVKTDITSIDVIDSHTHRSFNWKFAWNQPVCHSATPPLLPSMVSMRVHT